MKNLNLKEKVLYLSKKKILALVEQTYIKKSVPKVFVGDTVKIGVLIKEGNKERIQYYQGIILAKTNSGINLTISVRKIFQGIGIERKFLIHSPKFESLQIIKSARVRRSKLYYLRKTTTTKGSRLKQRFNTK
nr:ribosomal protein L19 [Sargassum siliquastrum]YP_010485304.1 50S ribosomal protein L19 [Sargassum macrocarpum]YP_010485443.1 50S ribosomal protein L19 [Sargassum serratifolium]AZJ15972.1 50S ribosomal protein L19 [Sargassum confusum]URP30946.1 ribosomal protein L19 [Sargassum siliquastrum]UVW81237.1 50S ribosomal protein L19 [Sargassum macrocarpum]UVW81376.1 50S ribosomal protein L19 [Sargassum serratifolium]